jgi:hypothetical protein
MNSDNLDIARKVNPMALALLADCHFVLHGIQQK